MSRVALILILTGCSADGTESDRQQPSLDGATIDEGLFDSGTTDADVAPDMGADQFVPAARVNFLRAPDNQDAARAAGCTVGTQVGTGFARFTDLLGGLDPLVKINDESIQLVLIAELFEDQGALGLYDGWVDDQNQFWRAGDDAEWAYFSDFEREDDRNQSSVSTSRLYLPLLGEPRLPLTLGAADLRARWTLSPRGMTIESARWQGVLDEDALTALTEAMVQICTPEVHPRLCDQIPGLRPGGDPVDRQRSVEQLLGGRDAAEDGTACGPDPGCHGVSVCLLFSAIELSVAGTRDRP